MKVGIIGFSGCGKTTLFNALTGLKAETGMGKKSGQNLGQIKVPDTRVDTLAEIYSPKKTTYAEIVFVDFLGGAAGEAGKGMESSTIGQIRQVDALAIVVRGFDNPMLTADKDPNGELENFLTELVLADLVVVERRLERIAKEGGKAKAEQQLLEKLQATLEEEKPLRSLGLRNDKLALLSGFQFLTLKPGIVVVNHSEDEIGETAWPGIDDTAATFDMKTVRLSAQTEMEINDLDEEERSMFLEELGITESAKDKLVVATFGVLDLISFLTAGPDECRAWPVRREAPAVEAAGKIHSDIARGFIRAEVIHWTDFEQHRSETACKNAGVAHLEGKEYAVQDGDVINFRFNV